MREIRDPGLGMSGIAGLPVENKRSVLVVGSENTGVIEALSWQAY